MKKNYQTIEVHGHLHVLCDVETRKVFEPANYLGTGMALCAVLKKRESLKSWILKQTK